MGSNRQQQARYNIDNIDEIKKIDNIDKIDIIHKINNVDKIDIIDKIYRIDSIDTIDSVNHVCSSVAKRSSQKGQQQVVASKP